MLPQRVNVSEVLKSLVPKDQEELSVLRFLLHCAQWLRRDTHMDLGLGPVRRSNERTTNTFSFDVPGFLELIPEDSKRYLHGLVEALDIYQMIYGQTLTAQNITLSDKSVYELRQIRDMCLEDGLRSIY